MTSVFGNKVYKSNALCTFYVPFEELAHATVSVPYKQFAEWTADDHKNSFELQKRITSYAGQYLIFGKLDPGKFLSWKIIPYKKCYTFIGSIIQRIQTLVGIVLGANDDRTNESHLKVFRGDIPSQTTRGCQETDSFCQKEVIERQWVLKEKHITVLFNHGEFTVVTNAHRETLTDLTETEYIESMQAVTKLINFLSVKNRSIKNFYLLHENGHRGTHWNLRLITIANDIQTFWEKCSLFKRFIWGPSLLKDEQVQALRDELKGLTNIDNTLSLRQNRSSIKGDLMIGGLNKVYDFNGCNLGLPSSHLLKGSLQVMYPGMQLREWTKAKHATSFDLLCRITDFWANKLVTITPNNTVITDQKTGMDQYLIYGKIDFINPFKWEIVPYENCKTLLGRIIQQIKVLYRTVFGGIESTVGDVKYLGALASNMPNVPERNVSSKGSDPFCKDEVIDRQWVLKGKHITVLLNHAPIGFGGEKLDFLVVPNAHRERFIDLTKEEYCESMEATAKIIDHLVNTRTSIKNVYLMHKTGVIAGQTVDHCLGRFIVSSSSTQEFWGKFTVLRNIVWGSLWRSSPMNKGAFDEKVKGLREELKDIKLD